MCERACLFNIQKFSLHDGPGIRTIIFFKGCPLRCFWCSNPESQSGLPEPMRDQHTKEYKLVGEYYTIEDIVSEVMKDEPFYLESGGGVTLSGGEVLQQADFAIKLLKQLKAKGIHTASETTGFAKPDTFREYIEQVDLLYFDLKHHADSQHLAGAGVLLKPILTNLAYALAHHPNLIIRIPIIPEFNDGIENAQAFALLFKQLGVKSVELLPFHQFGEKKYALLDRVYALKDVSQLHTEDLNYFKDILENQQIACYVH